MPAGAPLSRPARARPRTAFSPTSRWRAAPVTSKSAQSRAPSASPSTTACWRSSAMRCCRLCPLSHQPADIALDDVVVAIAGCMGVEPTLISFVKFAAGMDVADDPATIQQKGHGGEIAIGREPPAFQRAPVGIHGDGELELLLCNGRLD